jgi:hypothetical protein
MTLRFHKVRHELWGDMITDRVQGAELDEIVYADDPIYVGTDTRQMNKFMTLI